MERRHVFSNSTPEGGRYQSRPVNAAWSESDRRDSGNDLEGAYALGWLSGCAIAGGGIGYHRSKRQFDRDNGDDGAVVLYALRQVAPKEEADEILRRFGRLAKSNDPELRRGTASAIKTWVYVMGVILIQMIPIFKLRKTSPRHW
jgi:hypothetical protein